MAGNATKADTGGLSQVLKQIDEVAPSPAIRPPPARILVNDFGTRLVFTLNKRQRCKSRQRSLSLGERDLLLNPIVKRPFERRDLQ